MFSFSGVCPFCDTNSASGITISVVSLAGVSVSAISSTDCATGFAAVSTGASTGMSVVVSVAVSAGFSSFTLFSGVFSAAVSACACVSSFFLRPRFLGVSAGFSVSVSCFSAVCVSGKSLNKLGKAVFCTLFFCRSKFSPSFPCTV